VKAAKFLTILFVAFAPQAFAQTGIIKGTVKDANTKEEIVGANVFIKGSGQATITDINGKFQLNKVNPGTYTLTVSFISYKTHQVKDIKVVADKVLNLNILLEEDASELEEVVILGTRHKGTEVAVISEIKQSLQVVSGISSEQIKLTQDKDAAQVMSRIPGITILENRFVMVRGMPERYNQVLVNNVIAPSTEVDKRTFSFDLIPSSVLDRMLIFKSGAPEAPGDFAGGLVRLYTKNAVEENSTEVSVGLGFRDGTTFKPYYQSRGSATDFLGFDNGFRRLPSSFPSQFTLQESGRGSQIRLEAAHSLQNNWQPLQSNALPDLKAGLLVNRFWRIGKGVLSTTNTFNIAQSYQYYRKDFYRYFVWGVRENPIIQRFRFDDDVYEKENKVGIVSNWQFRADAYNKIEFKNLFNQIGENTTVLRRGTDFFTRAGDDLQNYLLGYRSRTIYNSQLEGTHNISSSRTSLNWVVGFNYLGEDEPDLRRFRTFRAKNAPEEQPFQMILPPSSNLFETGRYFGIMNELGLSNGFNFEKVLAGSEERPTLFKAGYLVDAKSRSFNSRYLSYLYPGFNDIEIGNRLSQLPLNQIFSPENIRTRDGFVIEEGTRSIDTYTASNLLTSIYVGGVLPVNDFNFSGGMRFEYNIQRLNTSDDIKDIKVNNPIPALLPFINADYIIDEQNQLRFGYSRTVNRPEFRELAPFLYYDYKLEASRFGNPNLKTATIDNLDFRYEYYPRQGETISLGAFYKFLRRPIETGIVVFAESPGFTYVNADKAKCYGLEFEFRKSLQGLTGSYFLDKLSLNINASYIFSEVRYLPDTANVSGTQVQQERRPLQGQSPYIINAGLYYNNIETGWQAGLAYNIFGERIFAIGSYVFPTIFELPRHSIDLTVTKIVGKTTMKFGIQDLLNARYRFYQDSDYSDRVGRDFVNNHPIFTFRRGSLFTASASYKF
jgi:hypothetical protein